jgi:hypothetical protein
MPFKRRLIVEPPTVFEVLALVRRLWWLWPLLAGACAGAFFVVRGLRPAGPPPPPVTGLLQVDSRPPGASVELEGHPAGTTPIRLDLRPGTYHLRLVATGYLSASQQAAVTAGGFTSVQATLWPAEPRISQLMPPLPGATLAGAGFLQDGRVTLTVAVPPGDERQLWLIGPDGEQRHIGPALARGSAAVSADGARVAYLAAPAGSDSANQPPSELWLAAADGGQARRRYALPSSPGAVDQLLDVSWSPTGQDLLLAVKQAASAGGQHTVLDELSPDQGDPRPLVNLPSTIVPGSYVWSPDGQWVTFVAAADGKTSLCLLGLAGGDFRYLGDLSLGGSAHPLPLAPASWPASGGSLLYSAWNGQPPDATSWLLGGAVSPALFTVNPAAPVPRLVASGAGQAPVRLADGSLLALARGKGSGPLLLRHVEDGNRPADGPPLPIPPSGVYGARWDLAHAQSLIVVRGTGLSLAGETDQYWLARFGQEAAS